MQNIKNNKSKTIGYVVPMGKGLDSFVYREIEQLINMGMNIVLFSTKFKKHDIYSPKPEWPYFILPSWLLLLFLPVIAIKSVFHPLILVHAIRNKAIVDLVFALHYSSRMKRSGVDQIHCHFGDHKLFIGYYCKRLTKLPLSVTIHSHELHVNPNEKLFRIALQSCDRIFAISELAVDLLINRFGASRDRVELNRLFLDLSVWTNEAPVRVITVGRFEVQKGFDYLFKAVSLLKDINIEFVVVGFGPLDVRELARREGVEDKVVFFDKLDQSQLQLLYQKCDIYCLPSISHPTQGMEGIPVVLMEAMACGMPVVATSAGAVPEIVDGILVAEKSAEELALGIRQLANNAELRKEQGDHNRDIILKQYSVDNVKNLYSGLVNIKEIQ